MLSNPPNAFQRPQAAELRRRLAEPRRFIQVVAGPRQVGKTTLVQQLVDEIDSSVRYASADEPTLRGAEWIAQQWEAARLDAREGGEAGVVLALDEIQKIPDWSETVKRLWDQDTRHKLPLRVVLLGSAPLLIARGMTESLAGRFELLHLPHWSFAEMRDAFGFDLEKYLYFGGYPGAAPLAEEPRRWRSYVIDSLIETSISRDVLLLTRVDKPALLRRLFELACSYSGQILSYTKMLGQLQDAGNTTTLAHYLDLLSGAGMVRGLQTGHACRRAGRLRRGGPRPAPARRARAPQSRSSHGSAGGRLPQADASRRGGADSAQPRAAPAAGGRRDGGVPRCRGCDPRCAGARDRLRGRAGQRLAGGQPVHGGREQAHAPTGRRAVRQRPAAGGAGARERR